MDSVVVCHFVFMTLRVSWWASTTVLVIESRAIKDSQKPITLSSNGISSWFCGSSNLCLGFKSLNAKASQRPAVRSGQVRFATQTSALIAMSRCTPGSRSILSRAVMLELLFSTVVRAWRIPETVCFSKTTSRYSAAERNLFRD